MQLQVLNVFSGGRARYAPPYGIICYAKRTRATIEVYLFLVKTVSE